MATILGGGLAGLSAGYYLLKNNVKIFNNLRVTLLEKSDGCGGWIKSIKKPNYIFELGPRTIRPRGPSGINTLNMIEDLGLSQHVTPILNDHPAAKNRMIYANNSLHSLPSNFPSLFIKKSPFSKPLIYYILSDLRRPHKELTDDTIYNFVERRFGKEIADYAISPMICGICAGDAKEISVKFLMSSLFEYEQQHGGVLKGFFQSLVNTKKQSDEPLMSALAQKSLDEKWSLYALKDGLHQLPLSLNKYLQEHDISVKLKTDVKSIDFVNSSTVHLTGDFGSITTKHVFSTIPAFQLAKLVESQHPQLAADLRDIPFVTVGIVNLHFDADGLLAPAFGFLVPPIEKSPILGIVFDSCCLPDQKGTVLTVMLGGKWFNQWFGEAPSKDDLLKVSLDNVKKILNIQFPPSAINVEILKNCIPQYVVGHMERVSRIRSYIKDNNLPISVMGASYDGVGINDVIASSKTQIEKQCFD